MSPPRDDDSPSTGDDDRDGTTPGDETTPADGTADPERTTTSDPDPERTTTSDPDPERTTTSDPDPGPPSSPGRGSDGRPGAQSEGGRSGAPAGSAPGPAGVEDRTDHAGRRNAPPAKRAGGTDREHWLRTFFVDVVSSAVAVLLVGFFLFTVSGVWPPMVAVESPSMTPNMKTGDLVFVMEEERFAGGAAHGDTGVVTARAGADAGYYKFSEPGDVIVYKPNGSAEKTPIIHRAMFWVENDEKWYSRADKGDIGNADSCEELPNCPAPHAGFITKGDANPTYDQAGVSPHSGPVKPEWIVGTAEARIPGIGCIRLRSESCGFVLDTSALGGDLLNLDPDLDPDPTLDLNASATG